MAVFPFLRVDRSISRSHVVPFHVLEIDEAQIGRTDVASGLLLTQQRGTRDIAWASAGIGKFVRFVV